jgi:DinB family protein
MTSPAQGFAERLGAVRSRLARLAAMPPPKALTDPDARTGERWEWGQAWAHVAEFPAYWMRQVRLTVAVPGDEPVPLGRVSSDPARIAAIEADRHTSTADIWARLSTELDELGRLIGELTDEQWARRGIHSTLGVMDMPMVFNEFLVGHLESHAEQLEGLLEARGG